MNEADLRLHLARQTRLPTALVDVLRLESCRAGGGTARDPVQDALQEMADKRPPPILLFDTLREEDLPVIGRLIARQRPAGGQLFCAGSSGVEYALVAHWRQNGDGICRRARACTAPRRSARVMVISGSCSPVTDRQIGLAVRDGFAEIACDTPSLADPGRAEMATAEAVARAARAFRAGRSVIFQTARGPADARRARFEALAKAFPGRTRAEKASAAGAALGRGLAGILERALQTTGARHAIVCGGDTSTAVAPALGIEALEFVAPAVPGAPLCRAHAPGRTVHGCEFIFKGGQVGRDSYFSDLFDPNGERSP